MSATKKGPDAIASEIGQKIRAARKRARLTQVEVANGAGIHRTEVGLLERGKRIPRADTLIKVAAGIGVDASELIRGITWMPEQQRWRAFGLDDVADDCGVGKH